MLMTSDILNTIRSENRELSRMPEHYVMIIGELARIANVEPKTIRFYEKIGLLKPSRQGKFRVFRKRDAENLILVKTLRKYGLSTQIIRDLLHAETDGAEQRAGRHPVSVLKDQLQQMQRQHAELSRHIAFLSQLLGEADAEEVAELKAASA
jgi:DNA-binding transcriptional MerR regulator